MSDIPRHPVISLTRPCRTEADGKKSAGHPSQQRQGHDRVLNRRGSWLDGGDTQLATEYIPATDQFRIVYTLRMDLVDSRRPAASGIKSVGAIYNIQPT